MKRLFAILVVLLAVHAFDSDFVEDQHLPATADSQAMDLKKKPKLNKCKTSKDCEPTHYCKTIKIPGKKLRICVRRGPPVMACPPSMGPRTKPCTTRCRCGLAQGPCKGHATCKMGLRCRGEPGKCGPPMPPMPKKKTNTEPPADASSSEPDESSNSEPSSSDADDSSASYSEPSSSEPDDNGSAEPAESSSASSEPDDASSNSEPASEEPSTDGDDATNDDEPDAKPYDLIDMCKRDRDCAPSQQCKKISHANRKLKLCVPKMPNALEDESVWDFFEDTTVTEHAQSEDLGALPKGKKCKKHSDCKKPRVCAKMKGKKKGRCIVPPCPPHVGKRTRPCTVWCKCGLGQGKCSSSAVCKPGLTCKDGKCTHVLLPKPKTTGKAMTEKNDIAALNALGSSKDVGNSDDTETDVIPDDDVDLSLF